MIFSKRESMEACLSVFTAHFLSSKSDKTARLRFRVPLPPLDLTHCWLLIPEHETFSCHRRKPRAISNSIYTSTPSGNMICLIHEISPTEQIRSTAMFGQILVFSDDCQCVTMTFWTSGRGPKLLFFLLGGNMDFSTSSPPLPIST